MHVNQLKNRAFSIFIFLLVQLFFAIPAYATDVDVIVIGLTTNKAVLAIDGAKPRTVSVGQTTIAGGSNLSAQTQTPRLTKLLVSGRLLF